MRRYLILNCTLLALLLLSCQTVPLTGRKQLIFYPDSEIVQASAAQYGSFLKENKLSTNAQNNARITEIGTRIAKAVEVYMKQQGLEDRLANFDWDFKLVQSNDVNAWCMPGGKVVFYEGILPYCQTDDGIAVVMGHEIAHAVARHSNERMSQQMLLEAGNALAAVALQNKPTLTQQAISAAVGLGANYGVVLPFSRKHEYEADELGLIFMTMAGYNPQEAITFWSRMAQSGGAKPAEFMSTHPSDVHRIEQLQQLMPQMEKYKPAK
ncbi:MAG: M48 family metallopeptidase [Marinifilaceae bacterium]